MADNGPGRCVERPARTVGRLAYQNGRTRIAGVQPRPGQALRSAWRRCVGGPEHARTGTPGCRSGSRARSCPGSQSAGSSGRSTRSPRGPPGSSIVRTCPLGIMPTPARGANPLLGGQCGPRSPDRRGLGGRWTLRRGARAASGTARAEHVQHSARHRAAMTWEAPISAPDMKDTP
jgi:hypothetical protein